MSKSAHISILSFGDFIIDYSFIRTHLERRLIVAPHLKALYNALTPINNITFLDIPGRTAPFPLWNLKNPYIYTSLMQRCLEMRSRLHAACKGCDEVYLPNSDKRWSLIAPSRSKSITDLAYNIYDGYARLTGAPLKLNNETTRKLPSSCTIIPKASCKSRSFSPKTIGIINDYNKKFGIKTKVVVITPELRALKEYESDGVQFIELWGFPNLLKEISISEFVVCADSLPSHLCHLLDVHSFVIYKEPKLHIMPPQQLLNNQWTTFYNIEAYSCYINTLLA